MTGLNVSANSSGLTLTNPGYNPVAIPFGVTIAGTGSSAVYASAGTFWTIVNSGSVSVTPAGADAVSLAGGGIVSNTYPGQISGYTAGISMTGAGTVYNEGIIAQYASSGRAYNYYNNALTPVAGGVILGGGAICNGALATIYGYLQGAAVGEGGRVLNFGLIEGYSSRYGVGISLPNGGSVTNFAGGNIAAGHYGVLAVSSPATIINQASISAGYGYAILSVDGGTIDNQQGGSIDGYRGGIELLAAGTVTNAAGASIYAYQHAGIIAAGGALSTVTNSGSIGVSGYQADGVHLDSGGSLTNAAGAAVTSEYIGVQIGYFGATAAAGGTVINDGYILAANGTTVGAAVWVSGPAYIYNGPKGTITGGPFGIVAYDQTTVVNRGTIFGDQYAFDATTTGFADRIIDAPGAVFVGEVLGADPLGSSVYSTLELAAGASAGYLAGVGTQFVNFGQIAIDPGATWSLAGSVEAGQTILFGGANAVLTLDDPNNVTGSIANFATLDTIALSGVTATTGLVQGTGNAWIAEESIGQNVTLQFAAPVDLTYSVTNTATDLTVRCFAAGTRIQTPDGPVVVDDLHPGLAVSTLFAGQSEVIWVGQRRVDCLHHPRPAAVWPVHISAGAFGPGQPAVDLRLSPDHAVYVNDVLVPARYLVNGTSVRQVPVQEITYFHVELAQHDVLMAEGLAAESYLDSGDRSSFANSGGPVALIPEFGARMWEMTGCAPLVITGPELEAVRRLVNARAAGMGLRKAA